MCLYFNFNEQKTFDFIFRIKNSAPVMELVDMRVLGTRAFSVSVRVRPGASL